MSGFIKLRPIICISIIIYIILNIVAVNSAFAAEPISQTLTVTGTGIERIATTSTSISLGIEIQGKTATAVQKEIQSRASQLVNFLRSRRVENLETTGIRLQPNYKYDRGNRELIGYLGINNFSFTTETEAAGKLLDEAIKAGANRIDSLSFIASSDAIEAAKKQVLITAVNQAKAQAETVLKTLNLSSKEIINIQINPPSLPQPVSLRTESLRSDPSTPVIGGQQEVKANVTLIIKY
ncbi:MAG: SIMPL domain-containing protein [Prochloraceae cyanobacterium]|nr:SIMPL domain-containing protein [Prochloraceae cyanobacterium]